MLERGVYVCISMFSQRKLDLQSCWITTVSQRAMQACGTCTSSLWDFWLPLLATERHGWARGEDLPSGFEKTHPCLYYHRVKIFQDWKKTCSPSSKTGGHSATWAIFLHQFRPRQRLSSKSIFYWQESGASSFYFARENLEISLCYNTFLLGSSFFLLFVLHFVNFVCFEEIDILRLCNTII